jgi:hypothetical protein
MLEGVTDARFIYVDGDHSHNSDGGIFKPSKFGRCFLHGELTFPEPENIFSDCDNFAFVMIRPFL